MAGAAFYPNICVVCHSSAAPTKCDGCQMVSYCSNHHRKTHWNRQHKKLCSIIQRVSTLLVPDNLQVPENWYKYRTNFLMLCEFLSGSKLAPCDMNMILFPRTCEICHSKTDLTDCPRCLCVSYCSEGHQLEDSRRHKDLCANFLLCRKLDLQMPAIEPCFEFGQKSTTCLTEDIRTFLVKNVKVEHENKDEECVQALLSELVTCPLSLLYGLCVSKHELKSSAVVHVLGSSVLEQLCPRSWEAVLHVHRQVRDLRVVFVGPEVEPVEPRVVLCGECSGATLAMEACSQLYHDYVRSSAFAAPDVVCAFNCGLHEFEGTDADTWLASLPDMLRSDAPLVLTSFTEAEARLDVRRLGAAVAAAGAATTRRNPFASLRPLRDLESLEVYFNNHYITVVSNPAAATASRCPL